MKDWSITTVSQVIKGDIVVVGKDVLTVNGIGHDYKTGHPMIELVGARPLILPSTDKIEVYR